MRWITSFVVAITLMARAEVVLYPKMGISMTKTSNVMIHMGKAPVKIHIVHDVNLGEKGIPDSKCPHTESIKDDMSVQLSTSLTKLSESFGLSSLVNEESVNHLFGLTPNRGRRSTVSTPSTSQPFPNVPAPTSAPARAVTDSPLDFQIHCCDICTCNPMATGANITFQYKKIISLKDTLIFLVDSYVLLSDK